MRTLYRDINNTCPVVGVWPMPHLPLNCSEYVTKAMEMRANYGNILYSSERLFSAGFRSCLGVEGAVGVHYIAASQHPIIS